jgi:endonuclease G
MFSKIKVALFLIIVFFILNVAFAGSISGCEEYANLGIPGKKGDLLCRKGFLLSHDSENKAPIWVIEHLTAKKTQGTISRYKKFQADPDLEEGDRAELSDYKCSGYDKGHMAPAADMRWDKQAMKECFYLSRLQPVIVKSSSSFYFIRININRFIQTV